MSRLALSLIALLLCAGALVAQNINRFSNDPSGAVGVDPNGSIYFSRHVLANDGRAPTLTNCGSGPTVTGNDVVGKIATGSGATACTLTFALAYLVAPACVVVTQAGTTLPTYTTSTTAITASTAAASTTYNYICLSTG